MSTWNQAIYRDHVVVLLWTLGFLVNACIPCQGCRPIARPGTKRKKTNIICKELRDDWSSIFTLTNYSVYGTIWNLYSKVKAMPSHAITCHHMPSLASLHALSLFVGHGCNTTGTSKLPAGHNGVPCGNGCSQWSHGELPWHIPGGSQVMVGVHTGHYNDVTGS